MSRMIQIRNVPDDLHRLFKVRAARAGMSMSEYLLRELRRAAEQPTDEEILARLKSHSPVVTSISPTQALREERDKR